MLWTLFYDFISLSLNIFLWVIWVIIVLSFSYWLNKNTIFYKKVPFKERPYHRMKIAEELGFVSVGIWITYTSGFILIALGIFSLFLKRADNFNIFLGTTILGIIVILISFYANRIRKSQT